MPNDPIGRWEWEGGAVGAPPPPEVEPDGAQRHAEDDAEAPGGQHDPGAPSPGSS